MALAPRSRPIGRPPNNRAQIRVPARDEMRGDTNGNRDIIAEIRARASDTLDNVIDRSIRTGRPAEITGDDLPPPPGATQDTTAIDVAEEGIGRKLTALSGDPMFQKEYRMKLLHRMLVRQLSMDLIAQALNCTVRNVYLLREKLYKQMREEATNRDLPSYVGMTDAFYNDVIGMAMRMASGSKVSDQRKLGAMAIALQANRDRVHFYEVIGFHDIMKISPNSGMQDEATDKATKLIEMAQSIVGTFSDAAMEEDAGDVAPRDIFKPREHDEDEEVRIRVT